MTLKFLVDTRVLEKRALIDCDPLLIPTASLKNWYDAAAWRNGKPVGGHEVKANRIVSVVVPPAHALQICHGSNEDFSEGSFVLRFLSLRAPHGASNYEGSQVMKAFYKEDDFIWIAKY